MRRFDPREVKRVVVKVGTSSLIKSEKLELDLDRIDALVDDLASVRGMGVQPIPLTEARSSTSCLLYTSPSPRD